MALRIFLLISLLLLSIALPAHAQDDKQTARFAAAKDPGFFYNFLHSFAPETAVGMWRGADRPGLTNLLKQRGFKMGDPVYLRVFKDEAVIELWMQREANARYELFEIYPICSHSGALGPKQKEGDKQAPEGFYEINVKHLNPNSKYHLAINMGYPNAYDKAHSRTGAALMIHGACASIGCYALTNKNIDEVYALVGAALANGQESISVHAFPFRMTQEALEMRKNNPWIDFWVSELLPAAQIFDITRTPPKMMVCDGTYQIMDGLDQGALPDACTPITAWGMKTAAK